METKEVIEVIESKVQNAVVAVEKTVIKTDEDLNEAAVRLTDVKKLQKFVDQEKEKIVKPMREAMNAIRGLFSPLEEKIDEAERKLKLAMGSYQKKKEEEIAKKQESVARRAESGQLKEETAVRKMEEIGEAKKTVQNEGGSVSFKKVRKVRFTPLENIGWESLVTLAQNKFIVWDEPVARKAALAGLLGVGIEIYEDTEVAARV